VTTRKIYIGPFGPALFDDTLGINDQDGDFSGETRHAMVSDDGSVLEFVNVNTLRLRDSNESNILSISWGEDDSADRTLALLVGGGNRSLTLNENFTIGDGYAGTLTFGSACTLTVELASILNQDLTTDASPSFANLSLGTGELTAGSINRVTGTLTLEIAGNAVISVAAASVTIAQTLVLSTCAAAGVDTDKFLVLDGSNNVDYRTGADVLSDIGGAASAHTHDDRYYTETEIDTALALLAPLDAPTFTTSITIPENAGIADYDKFLVVDSGAIKYRTGAEVLSDIGAAASSHASQHGVGQADTVFPADPDADKVLMWDDDPGALVWSDAGIGDVTAAANITDHRIVRGDGGAKGIQESAITIDDACNVSGVASLSLTTGELTCGSINRAAGTLTIEIAGAAQLSITTDSISGNVIKDEDTMASDSAVHLATQQSIKAYVDGKGFVNRGDPAAWDWDKTDLTTDETWNDLDCSGVVPAGAKAVLLKAFISDDAVGSYLRFRRKGNSNDINRSEVRTYVISEYHFGDLVVPCDTDRFIQYYGKNVAFTAIYLVIGGWFI